MYFFINSLANTKKLPYLNKLFIQFLQLNINYLTKSKLTNMPTFDKVDKPSMDKINKLHPSIREEVKTIVQECNEALTGRAQMRISQGLRTFAEQDALYAKRPKVTNAKGGQSVHNYGFAVDIVMIIDGKTASWENKKDWDGDNISDWDECVKIFAKHGWNWGGDWLSFKDMPHFDKIGFSNWRELQNYKRGSDGYIVLKKENETVQPNSAVTANRSVAISAGATTGTGGVFDKVDKPSMDKINKLHPSIREEIKTIVQECNAALTGRAQMRISQALRTFAEQDALYAKRPKVTNAKGGQSVHNYGFAVDIVMIVDKTIASWDTKKDWDGDNVADWDECVKIFAKHGWNWGGDWHSFKDMPHFDKIGFGNWRQLQNYKRDKDGYIII
jgi:peptidoglycan LD-endopeptidase CwlK